jgi:hypothetical protein
VTENTSAKYKIPRYSPDLEVEDHGALCRFIAATLGGDSAVIAEGPSVGDLYLAAEKLGIGVRELLIMSSGVVPLVEQELRHQCLELELLPGKLPVASCVRQ